MGQRLCLMDKEHLLYKLDTGLNYFKMLIFTMVASCSVVSTSLQPHGLHGAPQVHGIFQAKYWNGLPFLTPEDLPNPGIEPEFLASPPLAGRFFTTSTTWEASPLTTRKCCYYPI